MKFERFRTVWVWFGIGLKQITRVMFAITAHRKFVSMKPINPGSSTAKWTRSRLDEITTDKRYGRNRLGVDSWSANFRPWNDSGTQWPRSESLSIVLQCQVRVPIISLVRVRRDLSLPKTLKFAHACFWLYFRSTMLDQPRSKLKC